MDANVDQMKYQRAKVVDWLPYWNKYIQFEFVEFTDTPDHDIPQTVIEALTAMPNMPVMIGGYLYRVVS